MIGRTNAGFGGGGGGFRLAVGLTAPANPRENTVWVKSTSACRNYLFSGTEPESPSEGLIWFRATSAGIITRADVYTGGEWVAADTYMYLGGSWMQIASAWNGELFEDGNLFQDVTGGWPAVSGTQSATDPYLLYSAGAGRLIMGSGKKIDITNYSQLHVIGLARGDYSASGGVSSRNTDFGIATAVTASSVTFAAKLQLAKGYNSGLSSHDTEQVVDISGFTGAYYIAAAVDTTQAHTNANIGIKRMWLT